MNPYTAQAVELLQALIATPSPSRDEGRTADLLFEFLERRGAAPRRLHHNGLLYTTDAAGE